MTCSSFSCFLYPITNCHKILSDEQNWSSNSYKVRELDFRSEQLVSTKIGIKHSIRLVQYIPWHLQNTFKKITNTIKETREWIKISHILPSSLPKFVITDKFWFEPTSLSSRLWLSCSFKLMNPASDPLTETACFSCVFLLSR